MQREQSVQSGAERTEKQNGDSQQDRITESGTVITNNGRHTIHCLTIIGQIEGHNILPSQNKTTKYEHVIPNLVAIEEDPRIDGLLMILNTVGGDVEAGLAIAELIAGMKKPTVSISPVPATAFATRFIWSGSAFRAKHSSALTAIPQPAVVSVCWLWVQAVWTLQLLWAAAHTTSPCQKWFVLT